MNLTGKTEVTLHGGFGNVINLACQMARLWRRGRTHPLGSIPCAIALAAEKPTYSGTLKSFTDLGDGMSNGQE